MLAFIQVPADTRNAISINDIRLFALDRWLSTTVGRDWTEACTQDTWSGSYAKWTQTGQRIPQKTSTDAEWTRRGKYVNITLFLLSVIEIIDQKVCDKNCLIEIEMIFKPLGCIKSIGNFDCAEVLQYGASITFW